MSALKRAADAQLLAQLQAVSAIILEEGPAPWRAIPHGDARRRAMAWVGAETLSLWRTEGYAVRDTRFPNKVRWRLLSRPGPRPITAETPEGPALAEVRENWMQRLARDLDLPGPLAEAGHRLVADGLRCEVGAYRNPNQPVTPDGRPRQRNAEEDRMLGRLDARRRMRNALDELRPGERAAAEAICLRDRSLGELSSALGVSEEDAADTLILALVKLSRFYGTLPGFGRKRPSRRK